MRTSASQFELMVEFMERHGDLSKPGEGPHGRIRSMLKWDELTSVLHLDVTGSIKPVDKWKKVWSDLKNNTKRKASKINQAAASTGNGPSCTLALTDLEQRVLSLVTKRRVAGSELSLEQSSTSLPYVQAETIAEAGCFSQVILQEPCSPIIQIFKDESNSSVEDWNRPTGISQCTPTPLAADEEFIEVGSPTAHHVKTSPHRSAGPRRRGRRRFAGSAPNSWKNLATEFVTENLRLRKVELQQQAQWQTLFAKFIDVLDKFGNK